LARYLQRLGIGPEQRVALVLERSLETLVALLGVMKAGGAYVPLEPGYPPERLALMLADADAVLTEQRLLERVAEQTTRVVCLDRIAEQITGESGANLTDELSSANLAYVIFTSGSTGQPKGVAIEHRQLANYLASIQDKLDLPANASYATVSTFAADLGHTMIFPALCAGGALHIISPERATDARALAEYFRREQIDCLKIVPSHLEALLSAEHPERVLPRQRLIVGGEASGCDWIAKLQVLAPDCRIFNHYGPTETTVGVLTYRVESVQIEPRVGTLPLGRPIANTQVYLLDADQQLVPLGTPGELHVGGANVARGYLNHPAQTAEKFIPNPFGEEVGARLYKTGDLARYLPDGRIQFLGRVDQQVKIRGYRIELGEIEVALEQQAEVREAVVLASEDEPGNKRLVAYVVPAQKQVLTISELRRALSEKLPPYMLPAAFVMLDALPLTPNGKVDRRALPAPDEMRPDLTRTPVVPRTPLEEALAAMWTEVLRLDRIGVHDNFFELGGHSLLAMRILSRLRETFQVELPLRILFETTTIAQLAQALIAHEKTPGQTENIARVLKKIKGMSAEDVREALTARQAAQSG
jgi:amino acid adenylation domain-containing protein